VEDGVAGLPQEDHDVALRIMKNVLGVEIIRSSQESGIRRRNAA
jgi:hypothetical protein